MDLSKERENIKRMAIPGLVRWKKLVLF